MSNRPVVTRVEADIWVVYSPDPCCMVIGGILSETKAVQVAIKNYGREPIVVDKTLIQHRGVNPLPAGREASHFAEEINKVIRNKQ
jgi:hypothetical protein